MSGPNPKLIVACGAVAFLIGTAGVYWQFNSLSKAKSRVSTLEQELYDEAELKGLVAESEGRLVDFQEQLEHLEKGVPEFAYVPTLLTEIEAVGVFNGVEITGVRPVPERIGRRGEKEKKRQTAYTEVDIEIAGRGSYASTRDFIYALEQFPKIVSVQQVNLSPHRDTEGSTLSPKLELKLLIRLFVFPPTEEDAGEWSLEPIEKPDLTARTKNQGENL